MKVFINDTEYDALPDESIIQLSDRVGIHIPRFCYHKHLSVVASCRMCLVDIEGIKNAQPARSTPVKEGMQIYTNSQKTKDAIVDQFRSKYGRRPSVNRNTPKIRVNIHMVMVIKLHSLLIDNQCTLIINSKKCNTKKFLFRKSKFNY